MLNGQKFFRHKLIDPYDKKGLTSWDTYEIKRFYDCKI